MISVIIPTYNRQLLLEKALLSVLNQTLQCDEIIIVDDGSEDETRNLVASFQRNSGNPIRYIYQDNKGAAAARNTGIRNAAGEWLCFLDSDDRFAENKIEVQYPAMRKNPDYLISHTREIWYRRGRLLNQKKKHAPPHGKIFKKCLEMCVIGMSTVMVHKKIFTEYGLFDESLPCCEDYDFWLRVSMHEPFLRVDHPLTIKDGGREDQLSVIHRIGMDKYRIRAICKLLESQALSALQHKEALEELQRKCSIYGQGCLKHGREQEGEYILGLPDKFMHIHST